MFKHVDESFGFKHFTYSNCSTQCLCSRFINVSYFRQISCRTYDSKTGSVTAMVAGYCESQPVTIGPVTSAMTEQEFSHADAEKMARGTSAEKIIISGRL